MKIVQIRLRNKHMYTYTSFRSQPLIDTHLQPKMSATFHIRQANPKDVVCWIDYIYIYILIFFGGRILYCNWSSILYVSLLSYQLKKITIIKFPCVGDVRERAWISQGYPRTRVCQFKCIWTPSSFEYRRVSFVKIFSKPPSHMHCSHSQGPMNLLVNQ